MKVLPILPVILASFMMMTGSSAGAWTPGAIFQSPTLAASTGVPIGALTEVGYGSVRLSSPGLGLVPVGTPAFTPWYVGLASARQKVVTWNNQSTGDYRPLSNFLAIPAGSANQALTWDLNGNLRLTDGTGAIGALEHP